MEDAVTAENVRQVGSMLEFVFGKYGQWAVVALPFFLLFRRGFAAALGRVRKVKGLGAELELSEDTERGQNCPHRACLDMRNRKLEEIQDKIAGMQNADTAMLASLGNLGHKLDALSAELMRAFRRIDETSVDQMKMVFYGKDMPDAERLIAGLRYVAAGHNHPMKQDVLGFIRLRRDMYEAAVAVQPDMRVLEIEGEKAIDDAGRFY